MIGWFFSHTRAESKASHMLGLLSLLSYILSSWCLLKTKLRNKQDEQEPCRLHFQKIVHEWNFEWWAFAWYSHWVCIWVSASEFGRFARLSYGLLDPVNNLRFAIRCKEEPGMALGKYIKQSDRKTSDGPLLEFALRHWGIGYPAFHPPPAPKGSFSFTILVHFSILP